MIKNFEEWERINEAGLLSRGIESLVKGAKSLLGKLGDKEAARVAAKAAKSAGKETVDQLIDNASKSVNAAKDAAKRAEKSAEMAKEILNKVPEGGSYNAARKSADDALKSADDAKKTADEASSKLDDAIRSGDAEKIKKAKMSADDAAKSAQDYAKNADMHAKTTTKYSGSRGYAKGARESGEDFSDDFMNKLNDSGGDISKLKKNNADDIANSGESRFKKILIGTVKAITWPIRGVSRIISTAILVSAGASICNLVKNQKSNEALQKIKELHAEIEGKLWKDGGISYTEMDITKMSFKEFFALFFAGDQSALPQKDANELRVMLGGDVTVKDFFSKLAQMCFEYPERYFTDFEKLITQSSSFYPYMLTLEKEVGISKIVTAIEEAEGRASKTLLDTFSDKGEPRIIGGAPLDFSNPDMKILLGSNEPVKTGDLIDESREFLMMMSTLRKKISNDSIESLISEGIDSSKIISREEFDYKSKEIFLELKEQLSKKEEVFVAIVGLILAYNKERSPFNAIYKFDSDDLYSTSSGIEDLVEESFALDTHNQLGRIYLNLSGDATKIFSSMGQEDTLFGVMEYSYFGNIMKSLLLLYLMEKICKMIVSGDEKLNTSEYTESELKEYQTILNQIQRKEGKTPTVTLTGNLDDETQDALKIYQKKLGLPQTGLPGDISLPKLRDYLVSIITSG